MLFSPYACPTDSFFLSSSITRGLLFFFLYKIIVKHVHIILNACVSVYLHTTTKQSIFRFNVTNNGSHTDNMYFLRNPLLTLKSVKVPYGFLFGNK